LLVPWANFRHWAKMQIGPSKNAGLAHEKGTGDPNAWGTNLPGGGWKGPNSLKGDAGEDRPAVDETPGSVGRPQGVRRRGCGGECHRMEAPPRPQSLCTRSANRPYQPPPMGRLAPQTKLAPNHLSTTKTWHLGHPEVGPGRKSQLSRGQLGGGDSTPHLGSGG